jgi:probable AcnD-accessory protein PrpF
VANIPEHGHKIVRIWQVNIGKTITARIPIANGEVVETGNFVLDGVTFPAAEIEVAFADPSDGLLFPTGNLVDKLEVPNIGCFDATFINAGIPTIFLNADALGYNGSELQQAINGDDDALARFETIRAYGAKQMGLITELAEAEQRQHTPKIAFVAPPRAYHSASGKLIATEDIDLNVRALSMGKLHHAMMGTAAVAIGVAAAIPGTLVNLAAGGGERQTVTFGHPSGTLKVGAEVENDKGQWRAKAVIMSRSARVLMEGWVRVPPTALG